MLAKRSAVLRFIGSGCGSLIIVGEFANDVSETLRFTKRSNYPISPEIADSDYARALSDQSVSYPQALK